MMLWRKFVSPKWGLAPGKGVNTDKVSGGLIMPEGQEIEQI
jgi:hypothetical protein